MIRRTTLCILALASSLAAQEELGYTDLLDHMCDLDQLWKPPQPGERCIQFSSYDRGSDAGIGYREMRPWDPKGWYANLDRGFFLREEERDGKKEYVMADVEGPGALVRLWSANPQGQLFFYIDGAETPTWTVDFKALTTGKVEPLLEPLAGVRARGCNCYAPFPFARHLKLSCSVKDQYYHANVRLFPKDVKVESFAPGMLEKHAAAVGRVRARLAEGPARDGSWSVLIENGSFSMAGDPRDPADWARREWTLEGPLVIRELNLKLTPHAGADAAPGYLRKIRLRVELDGRTAVDVPVCDFFGSAPGFKPYKGYPLRVDEEGLGTCRFPMPVRGRGTVALLADGTLPEIDFLIGVSYERRPVPEDALAFRASWHLARQLRTRPFSDFRVLGARGPGRFVGCMLMVANPSRYWWGEGDEKFFVDGEPFPSTFGTGTEDYFGYAWGDRSLFSSPYHAQPQCDGPESAGYICLDRFHIIDQVPFQTSFLFDMEVWHWKDVYVDYASTAWWYGRPDARSGVPPIPDPAHREAGPIEPEPILAVKGALEGESLEIVSMSGGKTETPLMGWYSAERWSGEKQLFWKEAKPGDKLVLALPVAKAGRYRLEAVFTRARDYAIVQPRIDGKALGEPIDLYAPFGVLPSERMNLGELELDAGRHELTLEITGKNERAVANYMVGLDYVRLVAL